MNGRGRRGLLARHPHRELAIADARRQSFGVFRRRILAIGRDEFAERAEQGGLRQTGAVNAFEPRLAPGLEQIAQRNLLLLMIANRLASRINAWRNTHVSTRAAASRMAPSQRPNVSMWHCGEQTRL